MLRRFDDCPGKDEVIEYVEHMFEDAGYEMDGLIKFTAWVQTDRCDVVTKEASVEDFCALLGDNLDKMSEHHFVAKHQARSMKAQKKTSLQLLKP